MQLYERITSNSGRVTYREYVPAALPNVEIASDQVVTIFCTLVVSIFMSLSEQLLEHSKLHRETKLLEQAVLRYAKLNGGKIDPKTVEIGVDAWNAAIKSIQFGLSHD